MNDSYVIDSDGNQYWSDTDGNVVVYFDKATKTYTQYDAFGNTVSTWSADVWSAPGVVKPTKNAALLRFAVFAGLIIFALGKV